MALDPPTIPMNRNIQLAGLLLALVLGGFLISRSSDPAGLSEPQAALEIDSEAQVAKVGGDELAAPESADPRDERRSAMPETVAAAAPVAKKSDSSTSRDDGAPALHGIVVDELGRSISGAEVAVTGKISAGSIIDLGELALSETTTTDTHGRFRIPRGYWPKMEVKVNLKARGHLLNESTSTPSSVTGDGDLGTFELEQGVILGGVVTDSTGQAVAGASIWRTNPGGGAGFPQIFAMANKLGRFGEAATESDEQGRFELPHEMPGAYVIHVDHEEHPRGEFTGTSPGAGMQDTNLRLQLEKGAQISGRLLEFPPLRKGVTVRATALNAQVDGELSPMMGLFGSGSEDDHKGTPDASGNFVIKGLSAGEKYTLRAYVRDGIMNTLPCSDTKTASAGSGDHELLWDKGAGVRFEVQDAETGKPIATGEVRYRWSDAKATMANARKMLKFSGSDVLIGELRPNPSPGNLEIAVSSEGYLEQRKLGISVEENQERNVGVIRLRPAPTLRVQVLEASSGEPVRRARVVLRPDVEDEDEFFGLGGQHSTGKTDRDGWCAIEACSTPTGSLSVRRRGFAPLDINGMTMPSSGEQTEIVRLSPGGEIEIMVLEGDRSPAVEVGVIHEMPDGEKETRTTSKEGRLTYKDQLPGEHRFRTSRDVRRRRGARARVSSSSEAEENWKTVVLGGGAQATLVIELAPTTTLKGRVTLHGEPVAHAKVSLLPGESLSEQDELLADLRERMSQMTNRKSTTTTTDSGGEFVLEKQPLGRAQLRISRGGGIQPHYVSVDLGPGQNHVDVELPGSSVEGRVVDADGRPIVGAGVRVQRVRAAAGEADEWEAQGLKMASSFFGGSSGFGNQTDTLGKFTIEGIPSDVSLVVQVQAEGYIEGASEAFEARNNEQLRGRQVKLAAAGSIRVLAPGAGRMFRPIYAQRIGGEDGPARRAMSMVRGGIATLKDLAPGDWQVSEEQGADGLPALVVAGEMVEVQLGK